MSPSQPSVLFDHIALGLERIDDAPPFLVGRLGGRRLFGDISPEFRFWQWEYAGGGRLEVLEPWGPDGGFMHRFLAARGPGVHHVTFKVSDLRATCDRAASLGYTIVGFDDRDPGWMEAFLHPKEALGIVVQFAQAAPGSDDENEHERERDAGPVPLEPSQRPEAVELVGLRLRAPHREAARRQWETLCGGTPVSEDARGADMVYRFQGSPMRLAIELDDTQPPGPIAIEIAGREVALPEVEVAKLGVIFQRTSRREG